MVAEVGALRVTVGADISGLSTGMRRAQREVAQSTAAMSKSTRDLQLSFKEVATFSSRLFRTGALVFGGAFGAKKLLDIADAAKNLSAQLRLATSQYGSFAQANKDVQGIAERSRSDLLATAELYSSLLRNSDQFGAGQAQVARVTETVSKAFKISGATADEAANATRQLVQAFQSGRLQGDEFRSMMENAPRLARLLADSLGITIGQLRQLSKDGKLTADTLVRAFSDQKFTAGIDAEFKQLPVTFDQAMGQLYNAAVLTFGAFDQGGQFSTALANFVTQGTEGFSNLSDSAYKFGADTRGILDGLDAVREGIGSLKTEGILGLTGLTDATFSLRDALQTVLGVVDGVANAFVNLFQAPANLGRLLTGNKLVFGTANLAGAFGTAYDKAQTDAARRKIMGRSAADVLAEFGMVKTPPPFRPTDTTAGGGKKGPSAETLAARAKREQEQKLRRDAAFASEERQNQIALLQAEQDLTSDYGRRTDLGLKILDIEKVQQLAQIDLSVKLGDRTEAEAETLRLQVEDLTQLKKIVAERELEAKQREDAAKLEDARFDVATDQLQAESALATTAAEARDIGLRILDLEYQREKAAQERILADQDATEAAKEEARVRLAGLDTLFASRRAGVMAQTRGPLESWAASIPQTAAQVNEALQSIQVQGFEGLSSAIADVITGTKSLADAFGSMAQQILADIIRMTVRMLIFRALSAAFPGMFGGGGVPGANDIVVTGFGATQTFPRRAVGGPVVPGRTYLVGERGPELVRMGGYGQVVPNHEIGGGGEITINQTYSFEGVAVTKDEFARGLMFAKHDTIATMKDLRRRGRG